MVGCGKSGPPSSSERCCCRISPRSSPRSEMHRPTAWCGPGASRRATADDLFLTPTAEVPVTNIHRDDILEAADLPRGYTAWTPCFRREAGAHGKDTRGLIRVHQFDKVELVRFSRPDDSAEQHELMTGHAETVLQRLSIPYRAVELATGAASFA